MSKKCFLCGKTLDENGKCPYCKKAKKEFILILENYHKKVKDLKLSQIKNKLPSKRYIRSSLIKTWRELSLGALIFILALICFLFLNFIILFYTSHMVWEHLISATIELFFIIPWQIPIVRISGIALLGWYIFILLGITFSFIWLIKKDGKEGLNIYRKSIKLKSAPPKHSKNGFIIIPQMFLALLFINIMVLFITTKILNIIPNQPTFLTSIGRERLLFSLVHSSVYEEIITRVLLLGFPLFILYFFKRERKVYLYLYLVGGCSNIKFLEIFFIIFSAMIFGLAHLEVWDFWKFITTFISGLALGYLFLEKGLYATIILHFSFNYLFIIPILVSNNQFLYYFLLIILNLFILFWAILGLYFFGYYAKTAINYIMKVKKR